MASKQEILEFKLLLEATEAVKQILKLGDGAKNLTTEFDRVTKAVREFANVTNQSFEQAALGMQQMTGLTKELTSELILQNSLAETKAKRNLDAEIELLRMRQMGDIAYSNQLKDQEKKLALENMETQEYMKQLALLEQMAKADAQRLANDGRGMLFSPSQPAPVLPNSMNTGRFAGQAGKYDTGAGRIMYNDLAQVGPLLEKLPDQTRNAAQGFNVLRSAMGFLTAMAMSAIANAVMQMFAKIIDSASQAEQAFIKLAIAEKSISQLGVNINPRELTDIIEKVSAAYVSVSKIDAQKMVSSLAVLTKDLKLSAKEYEKLAMAIPLVAQQAGVTIENATNQVITGLTKSGRGWADLGITVDAEIIRQKAVSAGIVATREAYEALNAEQKQQVEVLALLQILEDNTINNKAEQEKYNNSLAGSQVALNAAWEDFAATLGTFGAPTIIQFLQSLTKTLTYLNEWLGKNSDSVSELSAKFAGLSAVGREFQKGGLFGIFGGLASLASNPGGAKKIFEDAYNQAKGYQDNLQTLTDTPTAPTTIVGDETNNQNVLDAQAEFNQAILDAELKLGQDLEDAKIDYERKLYDIDVEYKAKRLELENDYANKVADINRSYQDKIAEINQRQQEDKAKQRNDELQKEREFQNQLLVLKENFLMALDDALHARDARQILKLIKNYELDKAQAERKNALDKQSAKEDAELRQKSYNEDRKKAEADRKAKLAEAQRDYADKIAKLNADEAAEREAARLANERKIEDLHRSMQDRLEVIAAGLVEEYKLTEENLKGIVGLYLKYYNNATQILAAMRAQIAGTMQMMAQMQSYQYSAPIGPVFGGGNLPSSSNLGGSGGSGGSGTSGRPMANGGTIIANKPTTVTFGERGLEAGTFMPLGRVGKDVNSLFSNVSGAGDSNGRVSIELLLSPDLESRIVSNTLSKTAEVFTRTQRSKR